MGRGTHLEPGTRQGHIQILSRPLEVLWAFNFILQTVEMALNHIKGGQKLLGSLVLMPFQQLG